MYRIMIDNSTTLIKICNYLAATIKYKKCKLVLSQALKHLTIICNLLYLEVKDSVHFLFNYMNVLQESTVPKIGILLKEKNPM